MTFEVLVVLNTDLTLLGYADYVMSHHREVQFCLYLVCVSFHNISLTFKWASIKCAVMIIP